jgi:hypothetical protein
MSYSVIQLSAIRTNYLEFFQLFILSVITTQ